MKKSFYDVREKTITLFFLLMIGLMIISGCGDKNQAVQISQPIISESFPEDKTKASDVSGTDSGKETAGISQESRLETSMEASAESTDIQEEEPGRSEEEAQNVVLRYVDALNQYSNGETTQFSIFEPLLCSAEYKSQYEMEKRGMTVWGKSERKIVRFREWPEEEREKAIQSHVVQWNSYHEDKLTPSEVMILSTDFYYKDSLEEITHEDYRFFMHWEDGSWRVQGYGY